MIFRRNIAQLVALVLGTVFLANCATQPQVPETTADGKRVNPYPPGTYDHFKAEESYPKTYSVWKDEALLSQTNEENSSISVSLKLQRAFLLNGDQVAMDYPICSGIASRPTPPGTYYILEKTQVKRSNKYGKIHNAEGDVVVEDADATLDPIPEGGKFVGASMPYWMRLTNDGVGHHVGRVRRVPASHACIRGPSGTIPTVFSKVKLGTRVIVE